LKVTIDENRIFLSGGHGIDGTSAWILDWRDKTFTPVDNMEGSGSSSSREDAACGLITNRY